MIEKIPEPEMNKLVEIAGKKGTTEEFMFMMLFDQTITVAN